MFTKKRLFTLITVVTLLALLPTAALAFTFSVGGVSVTVPDSYTSCEPSDDIVFSNVGTNIVEYQFLRWDQTTGVQYVLGSGTLYGDASIPFPYPSITGTMTFAVLVRVKNSSGAFIANGGKKWSITCETPPGGEGCTPGYWKNHLDSWTAPYTPAGSFNAAFLIGANYFAPGFFSNSYTLDQAINQGGGGLNRLARHGTAALLSAAHPDVDYPYTLAQVIAMVQAGNIDPLAQANELGCPIN